MNDHREAAFCRLYAVALCLDAEVIGAGGQVCQCNLVCARLQS